MSVVMFKFVGNPDVYRGRKVRLIGVGNTGVLLGTKGPISIGAVITDSIGAGNPDVIGLITITDSVIRTGSKLSVKFNNPDSYRDGYPLTTLG